jgi:four helix bundle protein
MAQGNLIVDLSFKFALGIIVFTEMHDEKKKYNLARQLFKSGTSIGANVREAQGAESRADFIHKMKIAYKEAEETHYWLSLYDKAPSYPNPEKLLPENGSLLRIIGKIITSSKDGNA